jgi:hypothetical protein
MPSSTAPSVRRTARRLLKLASLGLAGLIAGLLSVGCNASPSAATNSPAESPRVSSNVDFTFTSATTPETQHTSLPDSLDARQIPALRHPPSARRLQYGSVRVTGEPVFPNGRTRS